MNSALVKPEYVNYNANDEQRRNSPLGCNGESKEYDQRRPVTRREAIHLSPRMP